MMKTYFYTWLLSLVLVLACNRTEDPLPEPQGSIPTHLQSIRLEGKIVLPANSKIPANSLLTSLFLEVKIDDRLRFKIDLVNDDLNQFVYLENAEGDIFLMAYVRSSDIKAKKTIEISAYSTAEALLMMLDLNSTALSELEKEKMVELYRKHPQFNALVQEIERLFGLGKPLIDTQNTTLTSLVKTILSEPTGKQGGRSETVDAVQGILKEVTMTVSGNSLIFKNLGTTVSYGIGIYDPKGKLVKVIPLEGGEYENISAMDLGAWAFTLGEADFFNYKIPEPQVYNFSTNAPLGEYKIKIRNGFWLENSEENLEALGLNVKNIGFNLLESVGGISKITKVLPTKCYQALGKYFIGIGKNAKGYFEKEPKPLEATIKLLSNLAIWNHASFIDGCNDNSNIAKKIAKVGKMLDFVKQMGGAINLAVWTFDLAFSPSGYDFCVSKTKNGLEQCFIIPPDFTNQGAIDVYSRSCTLYVYDDGNLIDGDIVSIWINGKEVAPNVRLYANPTRFRLDLASGSNWIGIVAISEGTAPPCTVAVGIDDGYYPQEFSIEATTKKKGGYVINVVQ